MRIFSFITEKWALGTLILLALLVLVVLLWLTQYIHPAADDYGYALRDNQQNFWAIQKETYLNWSGRYFGTAILQLNPLRIGSFFGYRLVSCLMLMGFATALYLLIEGLFKDTWPTRNRQALTGLLFLVYLTQCPSLPEAFYWLTGMLGYTLPSIFFLVVLVLLHQVSLTAHQTRKNLYAALASLLGIMIIGSNEMALIMCMSTLCLVAGHHWHQKSSDRFHFLAILIICSLAALVMLMAPGNFQRMDGEAKSQNLLWSIFYSTGLTAVAFIKWAIPLLVGSLLYILFVFPKKSVSLALPKLFSVDLRWLGFFYLATIFAMHFLFVWSTGERPTPRLENVIYFYLLLGWFYLLHACLVRFHITTSYQPLTFPKLVPAISFLLFLLVKLTQQNPITIAFSDSITGTAATYDKEMKARYKSLATSTCQTCTVPPLTAVPASIVFIDITTKEDSTFLWVNEGTAAFWKKDRVFLAKPNPPSKDNQSSLVHYGKALFSK